MPVGSCSIIFSTWVKFWSQQLKVSLYLQKIWFPKQLKPQPFKRYRPSAGIQSYTNCTLTAVT